VSNDNPYSESWFKTLKFAPVFPERFGSLADARAIKAQPHPAPPGHPTTYGSRLSCSRLWSKREMGSTVQRSRDGHSGRAILQPTAV